MTPDDARPEADEVGTPPAYHGPSNCLECAWLAGLRGEELLYEHWPEPYQEAYRDGRAEAEKAGRRFDRAVPYGQQARPPVPVVTEQTRAILQRALHRRGQ